MQYGYFDNENREYVIDRVDLVVHSMCAVYEVKRLCADNKKKAFGKLSSERPLVEEMRRMSMERPQSRILCLNLRYIPDDDSEVRTPRRQRGLRSRLLWR